MQSTETALRVYLDITPSTPSIASVKDGQIELTLGMWPVKVIVRAHPTVWKRVIETLTNKLKEVG